MLQISYIRENREEVIERLAVRNFTQTELIDEVIALDEHIRSTKSASESISAEANAAAKQIGDLMRQGKREEAEVMKAKSGDYKEQIKLLLEKLGPLEEEFFQKIVQLPNLPYKDVPAGKTADDNEVVL